MQAIDNAQVDKLVQLAQMYGPEITRGAINQVSMEQELSGQQRINKKTTSTLQKPNSEVEVQ